MAVACRRARPQYQWTLMESVWTDGQSWVIENRTTQNNTVNTKRTAQIVSQLAGSQAHLPRDLTQFALVQFAAFYKCKILTNATWLERDMNELCDGTRSVSVSTEAETEMWSTKHKVLFLLLPWAYIIRKKTPHFYCCFGTFTMKPNFKNWDVA